MVVLVSWLKLMDSFSTTAVVPGGDEHDVNDLCDDGGGGGGGFLQALLFAMLFSCPSISQLVF